MIEVMYRYGYVLLYTYMRIYIHPFSLEREVSS